LGLHLGRAGRGDGPVRDVAAIDGDLYAGRPGVVDEPVLDQRVGGLVEPAGVGGPDPDENHPADGPEGVADRDNHRSQFQRGLHVDARQGEQGLAHEHLQWVAEHDGRRLQHEREQTLQLSLLLRVRLLLHDLPGHLLRKPLQFPLHGGWH